MREALSCCSSQVASVSSRSESRDSRTNTLCGLRAAQKLIAAPTTQRSMFFMRSVRDAAVRNSDGSTSWPRSSSMRTTRSNMDRSSPTRLAIGCCTRRKRFAIRADLIWCAQVRSASASVLDSSLSSWRSVRFPPAAAAARCERIATLRGPGRGLFAAQSAAPALAVIDSDRSPTWKTCPAMRSTRRRMKASRSRVLPRSMSTA